MEVISTKKLTPPRILIYAEQGIGKSSLAAATPEPIFINTEDGLDEIDTKSFPLCKTFEDILEQLRFVYSGDHNFKTVVIDSLDWAESIIEKHVCSRSGKESITDFSWGEGHGLVLDNTRRIISALESIRRKRNMIIFLIAHSQVKKYTDPLGPDYDRHTLKLRDKCAALFVEWVNVVGFLRCNVITTTTKGEFNKASIKAVGGNDRVLSCYPSAGFVAKNRYGITHDIDVPDPNTGWENLKKTIKGAQNG